MKQYLNKIKYKIPQLAAKKNKARGAYVLRRVGPSVGPALRLDESIKECPQSREWIPGEVQRQWLVGVLGGEEIELDEIDASTK